MESMRINMPSLPRVEHVPENVPSTVADSVENTHPDHEGGSRNVEQSTQAQPEENSEIMDMKSWTRNHGHEIMDRKTEARKGVRLI
ncbi:hypothetical protein DY000_02020866 [Brassica cretica]|uniref:Uncharacterized protein n=1 Tax=Brassica cretica TaxID=69181 RepID=A0ABQ7E9L6_BRACR|nr:hypothetical protein DY000_02020866 [Brassica cretica]